MYENRARRWRPRGDSTLEMTSWSLGRRIRLAWQFGFPLREMPHVSDAAWLESDSLVFHSRRRMTAPPLARTLMAENLSVFSAAFHALLVSRSRANRCAMTARIPSASRFNFVFRKPCDPRRLLSHTALNLSARATLSCRAVDSLYKCLSNNEENSKYFLRRTRKTFPPVRRV